MLILPAIDIKDGRCVRLLQGDYGRETVFGDDPAAMAARWQEQGATFLHLVDLDGAATGEPRSLAAVEAILARVTIPVELGGGIRTLETIDVVLGVGVQRVILGTAIVGDRALLDRACERWGDRIVVGIDARNGVVATHGWLRSSGLRAIELAKQVADAGARRIIYTDVTRDGTLSSPNYAAIRELIDGCGLPVIAAGGVGSIEHLRRLDEIGAEGAIIGMALYTGAVSLAEAIVAV